LLVRDAAGQVDWKAAGEICRGDFLGLPVAEDSSSEEEPVLRVADHVKVKAMAGDRVFAATGRWSRYGIPSRIAVSETVAFALGLYAAEGHVSANQAYWSCHAEELEDFRAALNDLAAELSLPECQASRNGENGYQIRLGSTTLAALLGRLAGCGAGRKIVPACVFEWPARLRRRFLAGYLTGDGSLAASSVTWTTVSPSLAHGIRALMASLGLATGLSFYKSQGTHVIQSRQVNSSDHWAGRLGAGSEQAASWMGITLRKRLYRGQRYPASDDAVWFPVEAVERSRHDGWVYNLRVQEDESYTTAWGVAHNCSNCINPKLELVSQILTAFVAPRLASGSERLVLYYEPAHAYDPDLELTRWKAGPRRAGPARPRTGTPATANRPAATGPAAATASPRPAAAAASTTWTTSTGGRTSRSAG
jgi:intein/homing endonuclease